MSPGEAALPLSSRSGAERTTSSPPTSRKRPAGIEVLGTRRDPRAYVRQVGMCRVLFVVRWR